jgi:hypothetical protein
MQQNPSHECFPFIQLTYSVGKWKQKRLKEKRIHCYITKLYRLTRPTQGSFKKHKLKVVCFYPHEHAQHPCCKTF